MKATPFASAVAADVLVRDGRLAMARRNLHIPYIELLGCNGLPTPVGDGDYDHVASRKHAVVGGAWSHRAARSASA